MLKQKTIDQNLEELKCISTKAHSLGGGKIIPGKFNKKDWKETPRWLEREK